MNNYHGISAPSQWGVNFQSSPKALCSEVRLTSGSVKGGRRPLSFSRKPLPRFMGSFLGKRENLKITGKQFKRPEVQLQIGKNISHSEKVVHIYMHRTVCARCYNVPFLKFRQTAKGKESKKGKGEKIKEK